MELWFGLPSVHPGTQDHYAMDGTHSSKPLYRGPASDIPVQHMGMFWRWNLIADCTVGTDLVAPARKPSTFHPEHSKQATHGAIDLGRSVPDRHAIDSPQRGSLSVTPAYSGCDHLRAGCD